MQPNKKKSKQYLVSSEDIDERESQQQRILRAVYLLGEPLRARNKHVAATHYVTYLLCAPRTSRPHDYSSFICNCRGSVASGQDYVYLYDRVLLNYNPAAYSSTGQHTLEVSRDKFRGV